MTSNILNALRSNWGLILIAELLAFTHARLLSFLIILFVAARLLPIASGVCTKFVVVFGIATSLNGFFAVIAWFLHQPLTSSILLSLLNLTLVVTLGLIKWRGGQVEHSMRTNAHDIAATVAALAGALVVLWPVINMPGGYMLAQVVTSGGDNPSHIQIFKGNDLNRGVVYGMDNRVNGVKNAINYPQAWHFNMAVIKWLTEPLPKVTYNNNPAAILSLFYIMSAVWFAAMIFLIVRLGLMVVESVTRKRNIAGIVAVVVLCAAVYGHWLLQIFMHGFQSQIGSIVLLLITLLLLFEAQKLKATQRFPLFILATIVAVSIGFMWTLMLPIAFVMLAVSIPITLWQTKQWPPLYFMISMLLLGIMSLAQPLFYKMFPVEYEVPTILQNGNVQHTSMYTLIFLFVLSAGYAYLRWSSRIVRLALFFVVINLLFSLAIFHHQLSEIGELRYYYFKVTFMAIIASTILLAGPIYEFATWLYKQRTQFATTAHRTVIIIMTLIIGGMVCYQVRDPGVDMYLQSKVSGIQKNQIIDLLKATSVNSENGYFTAFIGSCNRGDDMRATQLLDALSFSDYSKIPNHVSFAVGHHEEKHIFKMTVKAATRATRPITIISNDRALSNRLTEYAGEATMKNINLINLDDTIASESIAQCPDRSRDLKKYPIN